MYSNKVLTVLLSISAAAAAAAEKEQEQRTMKDAQQNLSNYVHSRKLQTPDLDLSFDFEAFLTAQLGMYPACHVCSDGPGGYTTTPDAPFFPDDFFFGMDDDLTCGEMFEFALNGAIPDWECTEFYKPFAFELNCGCATAPTISPAPTTSMNPSEQPSASPAPSAGPCYLCGAEDKFIPWDSGTTVSIPGFDDYFPCVLLQDFATFGFFFFEDDFGGPFATCADIQAYSDDCGCPPLVPTVSPSPSASPVPSSTPTTTFMPSATPCYVCGSADVQLGWNSNYVEIDAELYFSGFQFDDDYVSEDDFFNFTYDDDFFSSGKIGIYCDMLQDYPLPGIFEGDDNCPAIQALARDCNCPNLDPTASPAPTLTSMPSSTPTTTPAPSEPLNCSCEGLCHGPNSPCGCWCDSVCKEFNDCCPDVDNHCTF